MILRHWDPFTELNRVDDAFGRIWRGRVSTYSLPVDVLRGEDEMVIRASVPGIAPEDIEVTVDQGVLTIAGSTETERDGEASDYLLRERSAGRFSRSVRLPASVDADKAETSYERGVVTVSLPKSEAARKKRLEIKISAN